MTPLLTEHPKWSPSIKRFYNKYHSTARFVGCHRNDHSDLNRRWEGLYRTRNSFTYRIGGEFQSEFVREFTIYTSETKLLEELISDSYFESKLDYIATPRDATHQADLENTDENIVFRNKLFYNQYQYKVESKLNYWRNPPDAQTVKEAVDYIEKNFKDTRVVYSDGRIHAPRSRYRFASMGIFSPYASGNTTAAGIPKFPTLYTNDTASLFLLKMSWGSELNLMTERVIIV